MFDWILQTLSPLLPWAPVAAVLLSGATLACILIFRYRDRRTQLKITYSVGDPEYAADLNDIPADELPDKPALYIKVQVKGARDVRLHNVFIESGGKPISFGGLGNLTLPSKKSPGDLWLFFQTLEELALGMRQHGYPRMKLVVRDGTGKLHKKRLKIPDIEQWLPPSSPRRTPPPTS